MPWPAWLWGALISVLTGWMFQAALRPLADGSDPLTDPPTRRRFRVGVSLFGLASPLLIRIPLFAIRHPLTGVLAAGALVALVGMTVRAGTTRLPWSQARSFVPDLLQPTRLLVMVLVAHIISMVTLREEPSMVAFFFGILNAITWGASTLLIWNPPRVAVDAVARRERRQAGIMTAAVVMTSLWVWPWGLDAENPASEGLRLFGPLTFWLAPVFLVVLFTLGWIVARMVLAAPRPAAPPHHGSTASKHNLLERLQLLPGLAHGLRERHLYPDEADFLRKQYIFGPFSRWAIPVAVAAFAVIALLLPASGVRIVCGASACAGGISYIYYREVSRRAEADLARGQVMHFEAHYTGFMWGGRYRRSYVALDHGGERIHISAGLVSIWGKFEKGQRLSVVFAPLCGGIISIGEKEVGEAFLVRPRLWSWWTGDAY